MATLKHLPLGEDVLATSGLPARTEGASQGFHQMGFGHAYKELLEAVVNLQQQTPTSEEHQVYTATEWTTQWSCSVGLRRPVLLTTYNTGLESEFSEGISIDKVASLVNLDSEVKTVDVSRQVDGPRWTVQQWSIYWKERFTNPGLNRTQRLSKPAATSKIAGMSNADSSDMEDEADSAFVRTGLGVLPHAVDVARKGISDVSRTKVVDMVFLPLAGTRLGELVQLPAPLKDLDLVSRVWPPELPARPPSQLHAIMSPAGAYTDFHINPSGSALWFHVLAGRKVFALAPPTDKNLATYIVWYRQGKPHARFLAPHCEGVLRVEVLAGQSLFLPSGWVHAIATPEDSVALACSFLHPLSLGTQLRCWDIEQHLHLRPNQRYPAFRQIMWQAAHFYAQATRRMVGLPLLKKVRTTESALMGAQRRDESMSISQGMSMMGVKRSRAGLPMAVAVTPAASASAGKGSPAGGGDEGMSRRIKRVRPSAAGPRPSSASGGVWQPAHSGAASIDEEDGTISPLAALPNANVHEGQSPLRSRPRRQAALAVSMDPYAAASRRKEQLDGQQKTGTRSRRRDAEASCSPTEPGPPTSPPPQKPVLKLKIKLGSAAHAVATPAPTTHPTATTSGKPSDADNTDSAVPTPADVHGARAPTNGLRVKLPKIKLGRLPQIDGSCDAVNLEAWQGVADAVHRDHRIRQRAQDRWRSSQLAPHWRHGHRWHPLLGCGLGTRPSTGTGPPRGHATPSAPVIRQVDGTVEEADTDDAMSSPAGNGQCLATDLPMQQAALQAPFPHATPLPESSAMGMSSPHTAADLAMASREPSLMLPTDAAQASPVAPPGSMQEACDAATTSLPTLLQPVQSNMEVQAQASGAVHSNDPGSLSATDGVLGMALDSLNAWGALANQQGGVMAIAASHPSSASGSPKQQVEQRHLVAESRHARDIQAMNEAAVSPAQVPSLALGIQAPSPSDASAPPALQPGTSAATLDFTFDVHPGQPAVATAAPAAEPAASAGRAGVVASTQKRQAPASTAAAARKTGAPSAKRSKLNSFMQPPPNMPLIALGGNKQPKKTEIKPKAKRVPDTLPTPGIAVSETVPAEAAVPLPAAQQLQPAGGSNAGQLADAILPPPKAPQPPPLAMLQGAADMQHTAPTALADSPRIPVLATVAASPRRESSWSSQQLLAMASPAHDGSRNLMPFPRPTTSLTVPARPMEMSAPTVSSGSLPLESPAVHRQHPAARNARPEIPQPRAVKLLDAEVEQVPHLVGHLRAWLEETAALDDAPPTVRDPAYVLEQLSDALELLAQPQEIPRLPLPVLEVVPPELLPPPDAGARGRKAAQLEDAWAVGEEAGETDGGATSVSQRAGTAAAQGRARASLLQRTLAKHAA